MCDNCHSDNVQVNEFHHATCLDCGFDWEVIDEQEEDIFPPTERSEK